MYSKKPYKIKHIIFVIGLLYTVLIPHLSRADNHPAPNRTTEQYFIPSFSVPEKLSFCGEPLPLKEQFCKEMLDRELTIAVHNRAQVLMWLKRSSRYLPFFTKELQARGLPDDLKYLPVAESSLIENLKSRAGAAGLWQFMKHTGRRQGLRITSTIDERLDTCAATRSALSYLVFLKEKFSSWSLALAAYNCGERRVSNAMDEQQANDYYHLSLPQESERYLYRLAAIKIILRDPEAYGYKISVDQYYKPLNHKRVSLKLKNAFSLTDFARQSGITFHTLKRLNPHLISKRLPKGQFNLTLPQNSKQNIVAVLKKLQPLTQKTRSRQQSYTVKSGDTLGAISRRFKIPLARLKKINRLKSSKIMVGQKLRLTL